MSTSDKVSETRCHLRQFGLYSIATQLIHTLIILRVVGMNTAHDLQRLVPPHLHKAEHKNKSPTRFQ